ncbi:MAG: flagellar protein [Candidatus Kapabacteria bacterium]|nr:flagellar protein [Candidatus Kapabacteria bacterium]
MDINGVQLPFVPLGGVSGLQRTPNTVQPPPAKPFAEILQEEAGKIRFSAHAQSRMTSRDMALDDSDMKRLENAVSKADEKGSRDSLVMLRDMAFIVSVRNRTVITALKGEQAMENVFTNIDSAVVA